MKKEVWVLIAWMCTVGCSAWANDTTVWHQGQLVLQNGTELKGGLNYNWQGQIVQYRQGDMIKAYSANQIQEFAYFDDQMVALRKFVSMECLVKSGLRRLRILEEVVSGPLLVYREHVPMFELIKASRPSAYASDDDAETNFHNFSYQVFFNDELIDINVFYRKVWPHIKSFFAAEYKQSASLAQAELMGLAGQIRIICWYNGLVEKRVFSLLTDPREASIGQ